MKNTVKLVVLAVLLVFGATLFIYGLPISNVVGVYDIAPLKDKINYGLDLTGGVNVVMEAKETEGQEVTDETLDKAIGTLRTRIDSLGVKEPTITKQGSNKIRISIPDVDDPDEALEMIGKTAKLEFTDPNGKIIMDGSAIKKAQYKMQADEYGVETPVVAFELNEDGTKKFSEATKKFQGQIITIKLDGETISAPSVKTPITNGEGVIEGSKDSEEAQELATLITAGALPVEMDAVEVRTIGPTLGQDSLDKSIQAAVIGIIIVFIFMLVFYLLPGLVADFALAIYIILYLIVMALLGVTLTLPGIAGMILSVGMAVDANIIIFERIKEEIYSGKSIRAAIEAGFSRATLTIIDSNTTTIIAGLVLFFLGSGTIQGFALTLMIGVIISMFTAVVITKTTMRLIASYPSLAKFSLYGIKEENIKNPNKATTAGGESNA